MDFRAVAGRRSGGLKNWFKTCKCATPFVAPGFYFFPDQGAAPALPLLAGHVWAAATGQLAERHGTALELSCANVCIITFQFKLLYLPGGTGHPPTPNRTPSSTCHSLAPGKKRTSFISRGSRACLLLHPNNPSVCGDYGKMWFRFYLVASPSQSRPSIRVSTFQITFFSNSW